MLEIDAEDTALIDGDPGAVRQAIIDETCGRTHWWLPHWRAMPTSGATPDRVGGMFDAVVRSGVAVRFTARVVEISDSCYRVEYVGGAYRGQGEWSFEHENGKTRLGFRWRVRPMGWLSWLLRLAPSRAREATSHHAVMAAGFAGLRRYLEGTRTAPS